MKLRATIPATLLAVLLGLGATACGDTGGDAPDDTETPAQDDGGGY